MALSDIDRKRIEKIFLENVYGLTPEVLKPEATLFDDLMLDELDRVEVTNAFEDEFGFETPDEVIEGWKTYGDVLEYVDQHKRR